jgi:hypothetical protein
MHDAETLIAALHRDWGEAQGDLSPCELGIDAPVAHRVGIGQGVARHGATDAHVVELAGLGAQACFDVAQTLPEGQLRKHHHQQLLQTREAFDLVLAVAPSDAAPERRQRQMRHQLCKNPLADVHRDFGRMREMHPPAEAAVQIETKI